MRSEGSRQVPPPRPHNQSVSVYHGSDISGEDNHQPLETNRSEAKPQEFKRMCLFCKSPEHYLSECSDIVRRFPDDIEKWKGHGKHCRNCGHTSYESKSMHTYAILNDGAEHKIILPAASRHLGFKGETESLALRTIRQDMACLTGQSVDFHVASPTQPPSKHLIRGAFTVGRLALTEQSYPVTALQKRYRHLSRSSCRTLVKCTC